MASFEHYFPITTPIIILLFLLITFLQSGIDKIVDWNGNVSWLKEHFAKTFMGRMIPLLLGIILVMEIITAIYCVLGVYELFVHQTIQMGFYACLFSCISLLMLLFGQRVAKDYAGALTITCYFIVAVFGLYILSLPGEL